MGLSGYRNLITSIKKVKKVNNVAERQMIEINPMKYRANESSSLLKYIFGQGGEQSRTCKKEQPRSGSIFNSRGHQKPQSLCTATEAPSVGSPAKFRSTSRGYGSPQSGNLKTQDKNHLLIGNLMIWISTFSSLGLFMLMSLENITICRRNNANILLVGHMMRYFTVGKKKNEKCILNFVLASKYYSLLKQAQPLINSVINTIYLGHSLQ